jgi:segregation and condensation protein A
MQETSAASAAAFTIKTEVFEGPLDLLLTLIEKRKLFISDISIAKVTDEYIEHVNRLGDYSLGDRTQFIYIASTLLLIKAKSLLPNLEFTEEEQTDMALLERRLQELAIMRKAGLELQRQFGSNMIFPRGDFKIDMRIFAPSKDATLQNVAAAIVRVIGALPKKVEQPKVIVQKTISLEATIMKLTDRIKNAVRMSFTEFSGRHKKGTAGNGAGLDRGQRVEVIVSFLAMLELVKQGVLEAKQEGLFDEIHMESQDIGVPRYNS